MLQIDARGCLIDILPALSLRADEFFQNVFFKNAQLLHPLLQGILLFRPDRCFSHDL